MAATRILPWVVMVILHIQVDAVATRHPTTTIESTTTTTRPTTTIEPTTMTTRHPSTTTESTTIPTIADESHLRLSGGPNECAGNVEIYYLGLWEKVCGHLWDMQDAQVVCRQLGCGFPVAIMYPFPPSDSYSYLFTEMNCAGNEDFLWYCPHEYLHGPCYYGTASVICSDSGMTVTPTTVPTASRLTSTMPWTTTGNTPCSGILYALSGTFQSPGYPNSYPDNSYCVWSIRLWDPARRIQLQFTDVELEGSNCYYDAIEVFDGGSPQSWLLGRVCRNDHRVFSSSGNQLTVLFRSDGSVTKRGFHAYYSSFLAFSTTMAPSTSTVSPTTVTTTRPTTTTEPTTVPIIADEIHLRLSGGPNECAGNVEIYYFGLWEMVCGHLWDMQDAQVVCRQLGCGFPVAIMYPFPPSDSYSYLFTEMNCAGNEDFLWYCPYEYLHGPCYYGTASVICSDSGMTVTPTTAPAVSRLMATMPWNTTGNFSCGGILQGLSGTLQSPGYPNSYPDNSYCVWSIRLQDPARRIQLQFTDVELEGSNCHYDAIEVFDGGSPQSWLLGRVCWNDHRVFNSSGNQLTVLFRSDGSVTKRGFHAYYSSFLAFNATMAPSTSTVSPTPEDYSCGGLLSSSSGTLQSPFYPRNYPNNADCVWEIQVESNFRVTLRFTDIQMEGGRCLSDYVEIYDGPLHSSPLLGKICSGYYPTYTSSSNLLSVRFHSNSRHTYRGFQATYTPLLLMIAPHCCVCRTTCTWL
ncbi:scavenger receptor cysteine-rich domain-containing protein DMBT1-like [Geothlypis trichas]